MHDLNVDTQCMYCLEYTNNMLGPLKKVTPHLHGLLETFGVVDIRLVHHGHNGVLKVASKFTLQFLDQILATKTRTKQTMACYTEDKIVLYQKLRCSITILPSRLTAFEFAHFLGLLRPGLSERPAETVTKGKHPPRNASKWPKTT